MGAHAGACASLDRVVCSRRSPSVRGTGQASRRADLIRLLPSLARLDRRREARTELAMPSRQVDPTATGSQGLAISNLIVRLLSDYTGRGPTRARTHFNETLVTV